MLALINGTDGGRLRRAIDELGGHLFVPSDQAELDTVIPWLQSVGSRLGTSEYQQSIGLDCSGGAMDCMAFDFVGCCHRCNS